MHPIPPLTSRHLMGFGHIECSYCVLMVPSYNLFGFAVREVDCKTVGFSPKSVKKSVKHGVRVSHGRSAQASPLPSLTLCFHPVPDLLFDCWRLLEYAKLRTVLQSMREDTHMDTIIFKEYTNFQCSILELSHSKFFRGN